jgi:serine protease
MALAVGLAVALVPGLTLASSAQAAPRHLVFAHPRAPRVGPAPAGVVARMYSSADPYSPLRGHGYRYGVIPSRARLTEMRQWAIAHPRVPTAPSSDLMYGGGVDGIGVTNGPEKVYLVFYGAQWGTQGTDSHGNITLSGDPNGVAPYLQSLFKGLGTGNELWSGVMTQYCDGVATGAKSCPSNNKEHVAYPKGGALAASGRERRVAQQRDRPPARRRGRQRGRALRQHHGRVQP